MQEKELKIQKDFEQRLTSQAGDIFIIDENGQEIKPENLRNLALKKLKKYQEKIEQNNQKNAKME